MVMDLPNKSFSSCNDGNEGDANNADGANGDEGDANNADGANGVNRDEGDEDDANGVNGDEGGANGAKGSFVCRAIGTPPKKPTP